MANIYVRSTDGSDSNNGSTWALAKATIAGATAIEAAGDVIYVSQSHYESNSSSVTWTVGGTKASPVYIIAANDSNTPPTEQATASVDITAGQLNISSVSSFTYLHGLIITVGINQSIAYVIQATGTNAHLQWSNCKLRLETSSALSTITPSGGSNSISVINNTTVRFAQTGQSVAVSAACRVLWSGGGIESGSAAISTFMTTVGNGAFILLEGLDLSAGSSSMNLFNSTNSTINATLRNCKLPNSWTGSLHSGTPGLGCRFSMYNCDSADTNYRLLIATTFGTIQSETTYVRTGGASDGTTPLSWKLTTNADAEFPLCTMATDEIVRWNETVGSALTATVEVLTDGVTLTDKECWLEVQYLGESGRPLGTIAHDRIADILGSAANQTTSSESWTTTGMTSPVKQKLSVSFTPQEKGYVHAVVKLAKASTTVYVDPMLTIA
jgi:hypothetical protein